MPAGGARPGLQARSGQRAGTTVLDSEFPGSTSARFGDEMIHSTSTDQSPCSVPDPPILPLLSGRDSLTSTTSRRRSGRSSSVPPHARSSATSSARRWPGSPSHVDRDDLTSAGLTALVQAAQAFDAERGVPFARYASTRMRGAIVDELRSIDWASRSVRRTARELDETRARLATVPRPGAERRRGGLGRRASRVDEVLANDEDVARAQVLSLEASDDARGSYAATLVSPRPRPRSRRCEHRERLTYLAEAIAELPERLRRVVEQLLPRRAADGRDRRRARRHRVPRLPAPRRGDGAAARRHQLPAGPATWSPVHDRPDGCRRPPARGLLRRGAPSGTPPAAGARAATRRPPAPDRRRTEKLLRLEFLRSAARPTEEHLDGVHGRTPAVTQPRKESIMGLRINQNIDAAQLVPQPVGHAGPDVEVAREAVQRLPHQPRRATTPPAWRSPRACARRSVASRSAPATPRTASRSSRPLKVP